MKLSTAVLLCCLANGCSTKVKLHSSHRPDLLNNIDSTWRVDISQFTGDVSTEIGVCKICGDVTDVRAVGPNYIQHFPVNGGYSSAVQQQAIKRVIAGWSFRSTSTNENSRPLIEFEGIQNLGGRVVLVTEDGQTNEVARWDMPRRNVVMVIQGSTDEDQ